MKKFKLNIKTLIFGMLCLLITVTAGSFAALPNSTQLESTASKSSKEYNISAKIENTNQEVQRDVTLTVEEYDKLIKEKYSKNELDTDLELLILQRSIVNNISNDQLNTLFAEGEEYKNTFNWLMNDLEMLRLYVAGGKPDGTYYQSLKVLTELYKQYAADLSDNQTTANGVKLSTIYKKMMVSLALTHSQPVSFWIYSAPPAGESAPTPNPNVSDPVVRYQTFKDMLAKGKLNTPIFEQLEVEEMRFIMGSFINNDEIEWTRDYIINSGKNWRSAYQFMSYKNVNTALYRSDIYYGENRKAYEDKYKLAGYDVKNIKYYPRLWHILEVGGVCWQISNVGQNLATSYGVPSVMLGQPGHVMYVVYELDANGNGWWSNWNDVGGWSTINANTAYSGHKSYFAVRLINGWGNGSYATKNMSGNYLFLGQAAMNDYDNFVKAEEKVLLANSFTDNETKEKIYKEALEIQGINLDAWLGLINAYIADGTKNDEDFYLLAEGVAENLRLHPLPMYDLLNLINNNIKSVAYSAKITALQEKTLQEATKATNNDSSQYGAIRVVANALLGRVEAEVAKFSFDGENAGVLALSKKYEYSNALWDYSLDGGKNWTTVTEKSVKLTAEELASITVENDILVHIIGVNYDKSNIYTIDIKNSTLPNNLYANDLENSVIAVTDSMEWRLGQNDNWTSFKEEKPDLSGNKTVEVRVGATGTYLPSESMSYSFTTDSEDQQKVYVPIKHLSVDSFSSENVRANKNEYEYARNTIDGNINTWWHTSRVSTTDKKYIVIKLDAAKYISAIEYIPKQNYYYGIPKDIKVSASSNGKDWIEVGSATFEKSFTPKTINFTKKVPAEYIKLQASTSYEPGNGQNNYFMNAAMINLFEDKTSSMPTVEVEYSITTSTARPVVAKIINPSTTIKITNNAGKDTYTFNENGVFTFTFEDENHNQGYYEAKVDWIKDYDFSLDGVDAGKIIISSKYQSDNLKWEYSIDGGNTWLNATNLEHQLTTSEIASLTSQNDIKIHITSSNDLKDINHTIDLTDAAALDQKIFSNDLENKIFGITEDIEWRILGSDKWISYVEEKPDLSGNKTVEIRRKGTGTTLCSGAKSFEFTDAYEGNKTKEYIPIDRLSIADVSSETVRPERNNYEYATNAIDGNNNTMWHSSRVATKDEKYIVIKMNAPTHVSMLQWVPTKNYDYGIIKDAKVYSSMDGITWNEVGQVKNNPKSYNVLDIELDSTAASKYIKVQAPATYPTNNANNGYFLSAASINLFEDKTEGIPLYVDIEYSTTSTTKDPVTATVVSNKTIRITNNEGSNKYTFTKNGKFTFEYVDEKGITGSVEAHVDWIDESLPVVEVVYSTTEKTNKDVTATIKLPEGYKIAENGPTTYVFTKNGEHTFEYINEEGHSGFIIASVTWIKKDIDKLEVKYNISSKTNKNVIATLELPEGYKIANNGSNTYTFTKNGSYTFYYLDEYGNTATAEAKVDWIKKDIAELHVTYDITSETSSNVTATLVLAQGIKITNNDGKNTYVFTKNGEFTFLYEDEYGNISSATAKVDWIKKDIPVLEVVYDITEKTNQDVTATLVLKDGIKVTNNGSNTHKFTKNGTYTFEYVDEYGNVGTTIAKVDWIKKETPVLEVVYDITETTNKDVTATLVLKDGIKVTNNGSNTHKFTKNGTYTFEYVDEYGNIGTTKAEVTWIDKVAPTPTLKYSTTSKTKDPVTVTLTANEEIIILNKEGKNTYTFEKNGEYTFKFKDKAGNVGTITAKVDWIKKETPVLEVVYDITETTNKDVTVTLVLKDGIKVTNNGSNTHKFTKNGTYTFEYVDEYGNVGTTKAEVTWIDKVAPTPTLKYSTTKETKDPVTVTLTADEEIIILNKEGKNTYTFEKNGEYTFKFKDKAGNESSVTAKVDWIITQTEAPVLKIVYDIDKLTNKNVTATLQLEEGITIVNNDRKNTYTFDKNGTFVFKYKDKYGNEGTATAKVDWIDKDAPQATLEYSTKENTYNSVTVTLTANEDLIITNNDGKNTYTFDKNGTFTFAFTDKAGNEGTITATVDWILQKAQELKVSYSTTTKTDKSVVATLELEEGFKVLNNNGQNTYTFTTNGSFEFQYEDKNGNIGTAIATVDWIDSVKLEVEIIYDITEKTSGNVTATIKTNKPIKILNNIGKNYYTFTDNGSFEFQYEDEYGNSGSMTATVTWIDKTAPYAEVVYSITTPTNQDVTVKLLIEGKDLIITNNNGSDTVVFDTNGTFVFEYEDKNGNKGSTVAIVNWIDKDAPQATLEYDIKDPTNKNVTVTIKPNEEVTILNNDGKYEYTFSENGTFTFEFIDKAGNRGTATATVDWIKKQAPYGEIKYNISTTTDKEVIATLITNEKVTITNNNGKNTYTFKKNGTFTFEYIDEYGNKGSAIATVTWIKETPSTNVNNNQNINNNQSVNNTINQNSTNESNNITSTEPTEVTKGDIKIKFNSSASGKYILEVNKFSPSATISSKISGFKDCFSLQLKDATTNDNVNIKGEEFSVVAKLKANKKFKALYRVLDDYTIEEIKDYTLKDGYVEFQENNPRSYIINYEEPESEKDDTIVKENPKEEVNYPLLIIISMIIIVALGWCFYKKQNIKIKKK